MAYNDTGRGAGDQAPASSYPHARGLAIAVLAALVVLAALRFFYGSIRIEGGVK
jgi:hypothetical protein